ncbi:Copia protein [Dufourea novaeangliae]|uniref:Copia protein n=1 Tax=Dufourea novaeangliae TaxID=178035 RepID=A0A154P925_DUFNO|nr:Copia protein [Dufourea novaeangliae]
MADSQLSMNFWAEAMYSSAHIKNRIKSSAYGKTLYELWYRRRPNIKYMKRFGCIAYILNKERLRNKFEPKTLKGIFLGYADNNTYRV